jgi:glyoxylase-like metal-dependent hydrolase (beta-lactamase superfamily II)
MKSRQARTRRAVVSTAVAFSLAACHRAVAPLVRPEASAVALTGGPNTSMIYFARTSDGVIAIDLGWWGNGGAVEHALKEISASPSDVVAVFLTHGHRDHTAAWPRVRRSRFYMGEAERPLLFGERRFRGWIPRIVEHIKPSGLPRPDEVDVRGFSGDTTFVFGRDTLFAFAVPGHTPGSTAYLFRGVLFLGDAVTYTAWGGFGSARRGYSDDSRGAARNLEKLWARLPESEVRYVCTAHARCRTFSPAFLADVRSRGRH